MTDQLTYVDYIWAIPMFFLFVVTVGVMIGLALVLFLKAMYELFMEAWDGL